MRRVPDLQPELTLTMRGKLPGRRAETNSPPLTIQPIQLWTPIRPIPTPRVIVSGSGPSKLSPLLPTKLLAHAQISNWHTSSLPTSEVATSVDKGGGDQRLRLGRPSTGSVDPTDQSLD